MLLSGARSQEPEPEPVAGQDWTGSTTPQWPTRLGLFHRVVNLLQVGSGVLGEVRYGYGSILVGHTAPNYVTTYNQTTDNE